MDKMMSHMRDMMMKGMMGTPTESTSKKSGTEDSSQGRSQEGGAHHEK